MPALATRTAQSQQEVDSFFASAPSSAGGDGSQKGESHLETTTVKPPSSEQPKESPTTPPAPSTSEEDHRITPPPKTAAEDDKDDFQDYMESMGNKTEQKPKPEPELEKEPHVEPTEETTEEPQVPVSRYDKEGKLVKKAQPPEVQTQGEDYQFSETEQQVLKNMSTQSREFVVARLKENKKYQADLQKAQAEYKALEAKPQEGLPSQWYEHEQAYVLTPKYQQMQSELQGLQRIKTHYQKQVTQLRLGEDWKDLVFDPQTGGTVERPMKNDVEAEAYIQGRMQEAAFLIHQRSQDIQSYATNFKTIIQHNIANYRKFEDSLFPQYTDPELVKNHPHIKFATEKMTSQGLGGNLLAPLMAKTWALAQEYREELEEERAKNRKVSAMQSLKKAAGPSSSDIQSLGSAVPPGNGDPNKIPFNEKDFEAYLK